MNKWDVKKLGDVCDFFNGQAHEKCIDENGIYKLINSKFVSSQGLNYKRTNNALSPLAINDIVMVMSDVPNGKTLAKCFVVDENDTYTLNQRVCVIRSNAFDTSFLYYQLDRNKYFLDFDNGENQSNLRKNDILNCELLIPPLPEQQRIVAILDEAFAAIAQAKANAEQNLQNAKELFESYLQSVFENKGDGWEEKELIEITNKIGSGATPRGGNESYKLEGISLIRSMNVHDFEFRDKNLAFIDDQQAKLLNNVTIEVDDVLLNITGASVARCCLIPKKYLPARVNQHVSIIRAKKDIILPYFLNLMLTSKYYKNQLLYTGEQGATRQAITKAQLEVFKISFPSLKEQQTIVEKLDALSTKTKQLEAIYQQKINDLDELKKSILQKAFAGELNTAVDIA
jgi:type I restriction enzyme S subunit